MQVHASNDASLLYHELFSLYVHIPRKSSAKIPHLIGHLGSGPRLVGQIRSGIRVSESFQVFALRIMHCL